MSHDDAAAPHQVAHRRVRRRHPRPPGIAGVTRSSEPPRRLRGSAGLARLTSLEDPERLRGDLGLSRRLAGALRRRRRLVGARTLSRRGQLAEHARGRHAAVRVEDDSFGFQKRTFALHGWRGRAPFAAKAAQAPIRGDDSLSGYARLGRTVLSHTSADGPRAAARYCSHGTIRRDLAGWHSAHDGVHLGLEGRRHPLTCYASTTQCSTALPLHRYTLHSTAQMLSAVNSTAATHAACACV